jgi:hypothetical protein
MVVERFHARKFGGKVKKKSALRVSNVGHVKKQKTPVKPALQEVVKLIRADDLELLVKSEEPNQIVQDEVMTEDGALQQEAPNPTGPQDEAHQEK